MAATECFSQHMGFSRTPISIDQARSHLSYSRDRRSFTSGQGIAEEDRFTNLLETSLNQRTSGFRYEVLNLGKPGAETIDHLVILKDIVLKARPDFVLLQWYVNDFEGHDKTARPKFIPLVPSSTVHRIMYRSSAFYYLATRQWNSIQKTFGLSGSYENYMLQRFGDPQSPQSQQALQLLKDFVELCKREKTPVGFVYFRMRVPIRKQLILLIISMTGCSNSAGSRTSSA